MDAITILQEFYADCIDKGLSISEAERLALEYQKFLDSDE